ncbi:MAG: amino acid permease [Adlercreutzia equolifaciens]
MMVMAIVLCVLYALQCFIATCIDPSGAAFAGNTDNAFYAVAKMAAGPWLMIVCAVGVALAQGVFTAIAQQNSIAFVMFTMANGGCLPKFMAKMNKRTNSPLSAVIFIIALSVVLTLLFHFSGIDMNTVVKISNFGALSTYVMLNVSVIVFCWFQLKQRSGAKAVFMHLVFPALGALVCFAILMSVGTVALVTGVVFILIGIAYYLVQRPASCIARSTSSGDCPIRAIRGELLCPETSKAERSREIAQPPPLAAWALTLSYRRRPLSAGRTRSASRTRSAGRAPPGRAASVLRASHRRRASPARLAACAHQREPHPLGRIPPSEPHLGLRPSPARLAASACLSCARSSEEAACNV